MVVVGGLLAIHAILAGWMRSASEPEPVVVELPAQLAVTSDERDAAPRAHTPRRWSLSLYDELVEKPRPEKPAPPPVRKPVFDVRLVGVELIDRAYVRDRLGEFRSVGLGDRVDGGELVEVGDTYAVFEVSGRRVRLEAKGRDG